MKFTRFAILFATSLTQIAGFSAGAPKRNLFHSNYNYKSSSFVRSPVTLLRQSTEAKASAEESSSSSSSSSNNSEAPASTEPQSATTKPLSPDELIVISTIAQQDPASLSTFLMSKLSQMPTNTILTLRLAAEGEFTSQDVTVTEEQKKDMETVGRALVDIMDTQLEAGRDLLKSFLECGEIRKLDGAIARGIKGDKLDMAFFTVLSMNLKDATLEAQEGGEATAPSAEGEMGSGENPGRLQILQHIYTRCQEEVEKTVSPGVGLLNKILRTEQASIRANQLRHYLCPQEPKTIKSPDGQEVQLGGSDALVKPSELLDAMKNAVTQIRTVEKSGGADKVAAAGLVESCRQVAIEARLAVGESYGVESVELKEFEEGLQPVFRPESADSEYIQGA
jgi:hypothetical protein